MRMDKGNRFIDGLADWAPEDWERNDAPPVFSEAFLYEAVGKGDARFVLGVADEYRHIIEALGPDFGPSSRSSHAWSRAWASVRRLSSSSKMLATSEISDEVTITLRRKKPAPKPKGAKRRNTAKAK